MTCPKCKKEHDDNYPLDIDGTIYEGGCFECWSIDFDDKGYTIEEGERFYPWHNIVGRKF